MEKIIGLIGIASSITLYMFTDDNVTMLVLIILMLVSGVIYFKANILNPFVWMAPFVVLYNVAFYLLDLLGARYSSHVSEIFNSVVLSEMTLFIYSAIFVRSPQKQKDTNNSLSFFTQKRIKLISKLCFITSFILLAYIPLFLKSGYTSKMEMNSEGGLFGLGFFSNLFILLYTFLSYYQCLTEHKFPKKMAIYALSITLAISVFLGERDVFLSIALSSFLCYYKFYKPSLKTVAIVGIVGLLMVPILGATKQITNRDDSQLQQTPFLIELFEGEFLSSGRNIETLLSNKSTWQYQHGKSLIYDLLRSVFPSSFVPVDNSTSWFNKRYNDRFDVGFGAGFSFIGEGYLQGGYFGVVIWLLLLAIIYKTLYKKSNTILGGTAYIYMIGHAVYAMRGDFSYVFAPLIKQVVLIYLVGYLILKLFRNNKRLYVAQLK